MFEVGTLDQFADITMGQSPKGTSVSNKGEIPLLNGPTEFGINHPTPVQFTDDPKRFAKKGDLLFCVRGSTGRMNWADQDYAIGRGLAAIRPKDESSKYFLKGSIQFFLKYLLSGATGTVFTSINKNQLHKMKCYLPDEDNLKKINQLLGSISQKIELNQKMNKTLEEIAKTLFKSWFIDFDPVRSKAEGRLKGLSKEISDLFPNSFEGSELGEIPKGWKIKNLGQILTFLGSGKRPKGGASITDDQVPSIGAENINFIGNYNYSNEKYVPRNFYETLREKGISIKNYDVLIYKDGANIGRSTIFGKGFPHKECTINEHAHLLRSEKENQKYLYFYLSTEHSQERLISLNTGSAQPGINQTQLKMLNILKPEKNILIKFDELVTPIIDLIFNNCLASNNLSNLRDTLLPKLISGEIKISDAESFIDEVGI